MSQKRRMNSLIQPAVSFSVSMCFFASSRAMSSRARCRVRRIEAL
jgi:hypothetical protein